MKSVNMPNAKNQLSRLVEAVGSGAEPEIILARNGKPAARIVPLAPPRDVSRRIGVAEGRFKAPTDSASTTPRSSDCSTAKSETAT